MEEERDVMKDELKPLDVRWPICKACGNSTDPKAEFNHGDEHRCEPFHWAWRTNVILEDLVEALCDAIDIISEIKELQPKPLDVNVDG